MLKNKITIRILQLIVVFQLTICIQAADNSSTISNTFDDFRNKTEEIADLPTPEALKSSEIFYPITRIPRQTRRWSHRKQLNVYFTPWSQWDKCDLYCKQKRERYCILKRRCGDVRHVEERRCAKEICSPLKIANPLSYPGGGHHGPGYHPYHGYHSPPPHYHPELTPHLQRPIISKDDDEDEDDRDYFIVKKRPKNKKKRKKPIVIELDDYDADENFNLRSDDMDEEYDYPNEKPQKGSGNIAATIGSNDDDINDRIQDEEVTLHLVKNRRKNYRHSQIPVIPAHYNHNFNPRRNSHYLKKSFHTDKPQTVSGTRPNIEKSTESTSDDYDSYDEINYDEHEEKREYNSRTKFSDRVDDSDDLIFTDDDDYENQKSVTNQTRYDDKAVVSRNYLQEGWVGILFGQSNSNANSNADSSYEEVSRRGKNYPGEDGMLKTSEIDMDNDRATLTALKKRGKEKAVFDIPKRYKRVYTRWSKWSKCNAKCTTRRFKRCRMKEICGNEVLREVAYCYTEGSFCEEWIGKRMQTNTDIKPSKGEDLPPAPAANLYSNKNNNIGTGTESSISRSFNVPEYAPQNINCGIPAIRNSKGRLWNMLRIIGGKTARRGQFPWQVVILNRDKEAFCGGTLISPRWVLTAAHCVRRRHLYVRLGEHNLKIFDGSELEFQIDTYITHPKYDKKTVDNDVALLKLPRDVMRTQFIGYACLPQRYQQLPTGSHCTIIGWGKRRNTDDAGTNVLHEAEVPIITNEQCKNVYYDYTITKNMFCAGHKRGRVDTCAGDSGGPLLCRDRTKVNQPWTIFGITSFGDGCGKINKFGIYTKVPNYVDWVWSVINCNGNCRS